MNLGHKILLFSILSISLPIGKLFEIFIWNNRITRSEIVFNKKTLEPRGRICFLVKIVKEIKQKLSIHLQARFDFTIIERISNKINKQSLSIQNNKTNSFKASVFRRFIFNIIYLDDSEYELRLLF